MNIYQLKYLIDLSKTSSINTTAKHMFLSQQALSESIKRLEQELGCTLLNRSKTGVTFTNEGKIVLDCAQQMLNHYDAMLQQLHSITQQTQLRGQLSVGVAPATASSFLPALLQKMYQLYPGITLYTQEHLPQTIIEHLCRNELDFGIFGFTQDYPDHLDEKYITLTDILQFQVLYTDTLVCVMYKNNPLSIHPALSNSELTNYKTTIYAYNSAVKLQHLSFHASTNSEIHQQLMKEEGAICCIPYQLFLTDYANKDFICRPITGSHLIVNYLAYRKNASPADQALYRAFIETALSLVLTLNNLEQ